MNMDLSILSISSQIINLLKKNTIIKYTELLDHLSEIVGDDVKDVLIPAINFLYLLGKVEYHVATDSLEYLNEIENNRKF
jgi:ABC-three component (ABC-3C) system Middle Component 8